ncbi:MAG TPA: YIP1 family protein [Gemmatimonadaceae bacterium]
MATAAAADKPSVWEDFVDIFVSPAEVFARRADNGFGIALLVLAIVITILAIGTKSLMQPVFDAEFARRMAHAAQTNPQLTPDRIAAAKKYAGVGIYVAGIMLAIRVVVVGIVLWFVGKLFDSRMSLNSAFVVATYSYFPLIIGLVVSAIIAFFLDPASITGVYSVSVGLGRFFDPATTSPALLAVLGRVDFFILWITALLGVGTYVVGKVTKGQAAVVAVLMWVIGTIFPLLGALRQG